MWEAIRKRLEIFRDIAERPWFRAFIFVWGAVGAWDLVLSQFVPEEYSRNFPKLYRVIGMTAGWLPLWTWLMVGALSLVAGTIEWAFRQKKRYLELAIALQFRRPHDRHLLALEGALGALSCWSLIAVIAANVRDHTI